MLEKFNFRILILIAECFLAPYSNTEWYMEKNFHSWESNAMILSELIFCQKKNQLLY